MVKMVANFTNNIDEIRQVFMLFRDGELLTMFQDVNQNFNELIQFYHFMQCFEEPIKEFTAP